MSSKAIPNGFARLAPMLAATVAGGLLGALDVPPFPKVAEGAHATVALIGEKTRSHPEILGPIVYPGKGLVTNKAESVQPGLTLIEGSFPEGTQVRLIDGEGRELHRWKADFFKAWPDAQKVFGAVRVPKSRHHYFIQGMSPLADGSIVLNYGELGAVRLDSCSRVIWRSDRPTHHSVTPTADGKFWIPGQISVFKTPERLLPTGMSAEDIQRELGDSQSKGYNNSVLLLGADGKVEQEFSVLQAIHDAGLEHALYASLQEVAVDPLHVNDIEIVTPQLAARIPRVSAGDLLLSIREMSMLAILDQRDGKLKWHQQGPWVRQHDVDLTADGMIEVFNNRSKDIGKYVDSSQIVRFDPANRTTQVIFPVGQADRFYTFIMGTHQNLDNGNRLIAESVSGRVFEVTPKGEIVWDFRWPYNAELASLLTNAMRIPVNFFARDKLKCTA